MDDDDSGTVEGSYRLPGHLWQVFLFTKEAVPELRHSFRTWQSGITGVQFEVPSAIILNREVVVRTMTEVFGATAWIEVNGPDSPGVDHVFDSGTVLSPISPLEEPKQ
jgi:hypothetical protein